MCRACEQLLLFCATCSNLIHPKEHWDETNCNVHKYFSGLYRLFPLTMTSYDFKVVLLGQGCVGKTSLVLRYVSNVFNDSHQSTLQASFLRKQLYLDQDLVRLSIWDTAGQEKFHALGPIYYRDAQGALLVYDVTSGESLARVRDWIKELNKMLGMRKVCLAIVGNKVDLLRAPSEARAIQMSATIREAIQLTEELQNARHYLASAKLNQGLADLFVDLARRMIEQQRRLAGSRPSQLTGGSRFSLRGPPDQAPGERRKPISENNNDNINSSCRC